jgi:serine/threonine protein kinase
MPSWPTQSDYKDALQNPDTAFRDPDLKASVAERSAMGVPRGRFGAFGGVYKMTGPNGPTALKLFNFPNEDRGLRYKAVSDYLGMLSRLPSCMVPFQYHDEGIRVGKGWFPTLTMAWVKGVSLGEWVRMTVEKKNPDVAAVKRMAELWVKLVQQLQDNKIAHGDLQHDNVMVVNDAPVLVDYDGMCVPALDPADPSKKLEQLEFGKPAYQHPARCVEKLSGNLDNFSAWVILIALRAIAADPKLYVEYVLKTDNENLLFTPNDMTAPDKSAVWPDLMRCKDAEVAGWAKALRESLDKPFARIPPFLQPVALSRPAQPAPPPAAPSQPAANAPSFRTRDQTPADRQRLTPQGSHFAADQPVPGLSSWLLERRLGGGGFGEVWLARHEWKPEKRAVKFCLDPDARHRLVTHEKKVILRVMKYTDNHPNVVPLLDHSLDGETPWLMYEYVEGGTLADAIEQWAKLSAVERVARAARTVGAVAGALGRFHRLDPPIIHRDLKPYNVLMAGDVPKINDFGIGGAAAEVEIARSTRAHTANSGRLPSFLHGAGTRLYSPPEQLHGSPPSPRDDVYALGVMAYQMLVGDLKYAPGTDAADELSALGVPRPLITLVTASVSLNPTRRPQDATEWETTVQSLPAGAARVTAPPAAGPPARKPEPSSASVSLGPINFACARCAKRLVVPRVSAGKQMKCSYCSTLLVVPAN